MTGSIEIRVENRNIVYAFTLRRNITVIRGNSATGKTTLIQMLAAYESSGEASGIRLHCEKDCVVLNDVRWKENLSGIRDSIVFIDEDYRFVRSQEFAEQIRNTDNYYVIVTRDNLYNLPYSVTEIYGIHASGRYLNLKKTYNELYPIYGSFPVPEGNIDQSCVVVEDSNAGYDFFSNVVGSKHECISAGGKTRIYKTLMDQKEHFCLIIADGAAFGPEMERFYEMILAGYQIALYLPESFEWLILKSGLIDGNRIRRILEHPEDYIDSKKYFSWERFFSSLLVKETEGTYLKYTKAKLNVAYLDPTACGKILDVLPEAVKNFITGE